MSEPLPLDQFVSQQLESGRYHSYEEMIQEGLRLLQEREEAFDRVAEQLRPAVEEFRSGHPGVEFDVDDIVQCGMERLAVKNTRS